MLTITVPLRSGGSITLSLTIDPNQLLTVEDRAVIRAMFARMEDYICSTVN